MSAPPFLVEQAIAFQLAGCVDAYGRGLDAMLAVPFDPDLYRRVSALVDEMRLYAAELPPVSVAWTEVMICHFELMHGLWRLRGAQDSPLGAQRDALQAATERLSHRCLQLMPAA